MVKRIKGLLGIIISIAVFSSLNGMSVYASTLDLTPQNYSTVTHTFTKGDSSFVAGTTGGLVSFKIGGQTVSDAYITSSKTPVNGFVRSGSLSSDLFDTYKSLTVGSISYDGSVTTETNSSYKSALDDSSHSGNYDMYTVSLTGDKWKIKYYRDESSTEPFDSRDFVNGNTTLLTEEDITSLGLSLGGDLKKWIVNGKEMELGATVEIGDLTDDVKVYPVTQAYTWTLAIDLDGGTFTNASTQASQLYSGQQEIVLSTDLYGATKTNYTLKGYKITTSGPFEGREFSMGGSFTYNPAVSGNTYSLKAIWEEVNNSYAIRLNGNGGTTPSGQTTEVYSGCAIGGKVAADPEFARDGYVLMGYSKTLGGSVDFAIGSAIESSTFGNVTAGSTVDIYSVWSNEVYESERSSMSPGARRLAAGTKYRFGSSSFSFSGDPTVYAGGVYFYMGSSGTYTITAK